MPLSLKRPPRFACRAYRHGVSIPAALLLADDEVLAVTVRNLSARGFMANCHARLGEGAWVGVDLPGYGIARAVVRWTDDGEIGCQFRTPVDVEQCMALAAQTSRGGLFARAAG